MIAETTSGSGATAAGGVFTTGGALGFSDAWLGLGLGLGVRVRSGVGVRVAVGVGVGVVAPARHDQSSRLVVPRSS